MESAYVLMLVVFVVAIFFGRANVSPWLTGVIAILVLTSVTVAKVFAGSRSTGGELEALLFISPFLVAAAILYFAIGYLGAALGRASLARKGTTASEPTATPVASRRKGVVLAVMLMIALPVFIGMTTSVVAAIGNWWDKLFR